MQQESAARARQSPEKVPISYERLPRNRKLAPMLKGHLCRGQPQATLQISNPTVGSGALLPVLKAASLAPERTQRKVTSPKISKIWNTPSHDYRCG